MTENQRARQPGERAAEYAEQMAATEPLFHEDDIILVEPGQQILDGQHRLSALIEQEPTEAS